MHTFPTAVYKRFVVFLPLDITWLWPMALSCFVFLSDHLNLSHLQIPFVQ